MQIREANVLAKTVLVNDAPNWGYIVFQVTYMDEIILEHLLCGPK